MIFWAASVSAAVSAAHAAAMAAYGGAGGSSIRGGACITNYTPGWSPSDHWFPKVFPRSDAARIERMNRYVEWRREKIAERRWRHLGLALAWSCLPPLVLTVIGLCWKVLIWAADL